MCDFIEADPFSRSERRRRIKHQSLNSLRRGSCEMILSLFISIQETSDDEFWLRGQRGGKTLFDTATDVSPLLRNLSGLAKNVVPVAGLEPARLFMVPG